MIGSLASPGIPQLSVLGKDFYDVFPGIAGYPAAGGASRNSFQVGSSSILTHSLNTLLPLRGEAGQELLHNIVVRPISSGRSNHCLLQINDVTVSVTRERVLRERQNARYHAIVDSAPDAIITTGLDRTIQWLNGAAEHVFGYAPSELLGRKIDILLERDGEISRRLSAAAQRMSRTQQALLQVDRPPQAGSVGPFRCFVRPLESRTSACS